MELNNAPQPEPEFHLKDLVYTPEGVEKAAHYAIKQMVLSTFGSEKNNKLFAKLTGFNPEQFALGLADSLLDTGKDLGAFASNIMSHPQETMLVLGRDFAAFQNDPQVMVEGTLLVGDGLTAWWENTQKEKGAGASYDMGKLVGLAETRLMTKGGLAVADTPERLEPAVGPKDRLDLMSDMFTEDVLSRVQKAVPEASSVLTPLFQDMNHRMRNVTDPLKLDTFSETMKNLYLHQKHPDQVPLKKESVVFLRNELLDSAYLLPQVISAQGRVFGLLSAFSALLQASSRPGDLVGTTVNFDGISASLFFKNPDAARFLRGAKTETDELKTAFAAGKTPGKATLLRLTDKLINEYFS